jgi:hypothetical protein
MQRYAVENRRKRADSQRIVVWDGDVMLAMGIAGAVG